MYYMKVFYIIPILYVLYCKYLPQDEKSTITTFADDPAIIAVGETVKELRKNYKKLYIKLNKKCMWVDLGTCSLYAGS